jgi:putative nucleotidyltransferase with HDIG domain
MNIENIISKIDQLTPIPQVATKIMTMAQDPECGLSDISKVVMYDSTITANILKIVNSAAYGLNRKIESIQEAVMLLGLKELVQMVFMSVASGNLKRACNGYDLEEGALWKHSAASAFLAGKMADTIQGVDGNLVFTAALLKDIGKVLLNQYVCDDIKEIENLVFRQDYTFIDAERKIIGIDHAQLGGIIAKKWNFSNRMVGLIQSHHLSDENSIWDKEVCVIYLADTICSMMGIGTGTDGLTYRFTEEVLHQLNYTQGRIESFIFQYTSEKEKINRLINSF